MIISLRCVIYFEFGHVIKNDWSRFLPNLFFEAEPFSTNKYIWFSWFCAEPFFLRQNPFPHNNIYGSVGFGRNPFSGRTISEGSALYPTAEATKRFCKPPFSFRVVKHILCEGKDEFEYM